MQAGERAQEAIPVARDVRGGNARHGDALCNIGEGKVGEPRHQSAHQALDPSSDDSGNAC